MAELPEKENFMTLKVEEWVMSKVEEYREHYETNYRLKHDEYYRLWRGIWHGSDKLRDSERSRLIAPALMQAVESSQAEIEEATFGRGDWFDMTDDVGDAEAEDVAFLRKQLKEDMKFAKARSSISDVILNAAVFGQGIGEIYMEEITELVPDTQPVLDGAMSAVGVVEKERFLIKMRPILPQNFFIDPLAASIEDALGCGTDIYVPQHQVQKDIDSGIYRDVDIGTVEPETELEASDDIEVTDSDGVRLTRWYGLVPTELFNEAAEEGDEVDTDDSFVECNIVIANGSTLLKIEANPFMMRDRSIVAFSWDTVPSRFWGRGVCEKGYNSQKALDTELRARIDALALTVHPMVAVDASRLPRGAKFQVKPGKTFLTNGNPSEIIQPFNFGSVDQITFSQGAQLQQMVQQATGAVDGAAFAQAAATGDTNSGGISMGLGAIIKRHKRTLLNFQDNFLIPFVEKAAWRYMQFEPELYKAKDYKFVVSSSLGIIAREYEVTQLVQLLQTMGQDSPLYPLLVESVVESMNLTNREKILASIKESQQPNPEEQEEAQIRKEFERMLAEAQLKKIAAETMEIETRIEQNRVETQMLPIAEQTKRIQADAQGDSNAEEQARFDAEIKIADMQLKERQVAVAEVQAATQATMAQNNQNDSDNLDKALREQ
ncbi:MAG: hypothetical protein JKY52_14395 [Flavobacteriales bacterium]|nr:hypothetical protein [Flavobacteriales bacterium]